MSNEETWQPIECAPRDGSLLLLFDPTLVCNAGMPRDRRVHNHLVVVGRWHTPNQDAQKSDWVTDIRSIEHTREQACWEADPVAPTHWSPLPPPPPGESWNDVNTLPLAYEYVLLYVPDLHQSREYPMNVSEPPATSFSMVIGCCVDEPQRPPPSWLTDICEEQESPDDPGDLFADAAMLWPTHWMQLPPPPTQTPAG